MSKLTTKKAASEVIHKIRELNSRMATDQFELCRLLHTLHVGSLHQVFGYETFNEFCYHELPFGYSHVLSKVKLFRDFKRLGYNKTEAIDVILRLGVTVAKRALAQSDNKVSAAKLEKKYKNFDPTITIHLSQQQARTVEKNLVKHGLDINQSGRRMNLSEVAYDVLSGAA